MSHIVEYIIKMKDQLSGPLKICHGQLDKMGNDMMKIQQHTAGVEAQINKVTHRLQDLNKWKKDSFNANDIRIWNSGIKEAEAELVRLNKQLGKVSNSSKSTFGAGASSMIKQAAGFLGAYIVARAIYSFGKESLMAYDAEAKNIAQLKAGLRSTGGISGKTTEGMESQANALEGSTLYKHSTTEQAQSILLAFNKIRGPIFDKAIVSAQDMATRLKMDLPEATRMLGKALQDPIHGMRMLRMAGISFTDTQLKNIKKLIEKGDLYKVQLAVMAGLQTNFGGSAEAAAKAGLGPIQQLTNKWESLKEAIGKNVGSLMNSLAPALGDVIDKLKGWFAIPISKQMEDERMEVSSLATMLEDANLPISERNILYEKLKNIQPDILKGIDKENINYQLLAGNVEKYNTEMLRSIEVEVKKEKLSEVARSKYKYESAAYSNEQDAIKTIEAWYKSGANPKIISQVRSAMSDAKMPMSSKLGFANYAMKQSAKIDDYYIPNIEGWIWRGQENRKLSKAFDDQIKIIQKTNIFTGTESLPNASALKGKDNKLPIGEGDLGDAISGISAGGSKATNITVNIHEFGRTTITANGLKESAQEMKDAITKALMEVLNSTNRMATQ